jgi:RNA polymerase sigma factor (sigma-70 family)
MSKVMEGQKGNMDELGKRLACGDEDAFDETVERYSRKVYGLCYRVLRDREEAKDMTQEVFVRVYTKHKTFKGKSSLYTWIYRIALNMCFSHLKKRKAATVPFDEMERVLAAGGVYDDMFLEAAAKEITSVDQYLSETDDIDDLIGTLSDAEAEALMAELNNLMRADEGTSKVMTDSPGKEC